jgi:hypothetical protein
VKRLLAFVVLAIAAEHVRLARATDHDRTEWNRVRP